MTTGFKKRKKNFGSISWTLFFFFFFCSHSSVVQAKTPSGSHPISSASSWYTSILPFGTVTAAAYADKGSWKMQCLFIFKSLLAFCFLIFCISIFVLTLLALTLGLKAKRWSHFLLLHLPIPASCKMLVMPVDLRMNSGSKPPQQSRSWMSKQNSSRPRLYALLVDLSVWPNQDLHVVVTQQANDMNCRIELLFPSNRRVAPLWYRDNRDFLFLFMIQRASVCFHLIKERW